MMRSVELKIKTIVQKALAREDGCKFMVQGPEFEDDDYECVLTTPTRTFMFGVEREEDTKDIDFLVEKIQEQKMYMLPKEITSPLLGKFNATLKLREEQLKQQ